MYSDEDSYYYCSFIIYVVQLLYMYLSVVIVLRVWWGMRGKCRFVSLVIYIMMHRKDTVIIFEVIFLDISLASQARKRLECYYRKPL